MFSGQDSLNWTQWFISAEHHSYGHLQGPKAHAETKDEKQSGGSAQTSLVSGLLWFWVKTKKMNIQKPQWWAWPQIFFMDFELSTGVAKELIGFVSIGRWCIWGRWASNRETGCWIFLEFFMSEKLALCKPPGTTTHKNTNQSAKPPFSYGRVRSSP